MSLQLSLCPFDAIDRTGNTQDKHQMIKINLNQYEAILFDWGDTIMKDFPDKTGKMRCWDIVEEVPNAKKTLSVLSKKMKCYLATSAEHSTKEDIIEALKRVELNQYFTDIFCYRDVGLKKLNVNSIQEYYLN